MRGPPGDSKEAFEELRRLILSGEREQLRDLRDRLSNKERRSQDVASILPEALKLSRERGEELVQKLDCYRAFANRRGYAFYGAAPDVAGSKDTWQTRLERER